MRRILRFLQPYRKQMIGVVLLYIVSTLCSLFMPYVMSNIVNVGVAESDIQYIIRQGIVMLLLAAASLVTALFIAKFNAHIATHFTLDIQKAVFTKINSLTFEEFNKLGTGSLITRSTEDIFRLQDTASTVLYAIVAVPIMFIGGVILSFGCDVFLSIILLLSAPIILLIVRLITRKMGALYEISDEFIDIQNKVVRERLTGLRVIRAFDKENYEHGRISDATRNMAKNIIKANVLSGTINPLSMGLLNLATVIMLYVASKRIQLDTILTAGDVIAVIQYVSLITNGLLVLSWTFVWMPMAKVSIRRINEVLEQKGVPVNETSGEELQGNIILENVTFKYDGSEEPVISGVNMNIRAGEVVGIIGGTGCGKTSISKLLLHFYLPTEGRIIFDGHDYRELPKETVRYNMAVCLQKGTIFEDTIGMNIRMGNKDASEEELIRAAQTAQIYDFIKSHEEGFEYKIIQAGANISGGQKQRVNIARTIIKKASVYIFDDSFSALDYLTESKLRRELNKELQGKTQIIITQRAATAMRCDKVYVMDRGRIVGCGTHKELLNDCAIYKEIYDSQLGNQTIKDIKNRAAQTV